MHNGIDPALKAAAYRIAAEKDYHESIKQLKTLLAEMQDSLWNKRS